MIWDTMLSRRMKDWDVPGSPGVKNLPCNAGEMGSITDWGTKTPHTAGQEPVQHNYRARVSPLLKPVCSGVPALRPLSPPAANSRVGGATQKTLNDAARTPCAATKTQHSQINSDTAPGFKTTNNNKQE